MTAKSNSCSPGAGPNAEKIRAFLKATSEGYKARAERAAAARRLRGGARTTTKESPKGEPAEGGREPRSAALSGRRRLTPRLASLSPQMAVADPAACADLFTDIASKENPDLPEKLDRDFVRDSVKCAAGPPRAPPAGGIRPSAPADERARACGGRWYADNKVLLDESGNWGRVSLDRFNKWLDWLHANSERADPAR